MSAQTTQQLISSLNPNLNLDSNPTVELPAEQITGIGAGYEVSKVPEWLQDDKIPEKAEIFSENPATIIKDEGEIKTLVNKGNLVEILKTPAGEKEGLQDPLPGADKITTLSSEEEDGFINKVTAAHEPN